MSVMSNATTRHQFIAEQLGTLSDDARQQLARSIEAATSLKFEERDRAALRLFLKNAIARVRKGEIDEPTARAAVNKVAMAAASNSPDVLNLIHAGA